MRVPHHGPMAGRHGKGPRHAFMVRTALPVADRIQTNAQALGMPYGEYISMLVADVLGMPEHAPRPPVPEQEELPLKTA